MEIDRELLYTARTPVKRLGAVGTGVIPADTSTIIHVVTTLAQETLEALVRPGQATMSAASAAIIADVLDVIRHAAAPPDPWRRRLRARPLVAVQILTRDTVEDSVHDHAVAAIIDVAQNPATKD